MIIQRALGNKKNIRNDGNPYTIFIFMSFYSNAFTINEIVKCFYTIISKTAKTMMTIWYRLSMQVILVEILSV